MARSSSPDIPGEHVKVAYRVVGYATVSGPPETCRSPQLSPTSGFACAAIQQLRAVHRPEIHWSREQPRKVRELHLEVDAS